MRYFFFSAVYTEGFHKQAFQNFTTDLLIYPTNKRLIELIEYNVPSVRDITILSISELTEKDYKNFWK